MIDKMYELETYNGENIEVFYDTENEQVFSVENPNEKFCFKTDDVITVINFYNVKNVIVTHWFISMCYDELEERYRNELLTISELLLLNAIQERGFYIEILKKNLRVELKEYTEQFISNVDYDVLVGGIIEHEHLTLVKLFHAFCIRDIFYSYELIKKVYDIAFLNHYNFMFSNSTTFYDFLMEKFYFYDKEYNPFDWGSVIKFFERIVAEEGIKNDK